MIHADFETFSFLNLRHVGAFRYAEHKSTEVLILAYAFDNGPVHVWVEGRAEPEELWRRVAEGEEFAAHNAQFEYCIWNKVLRKRFPKCPKLKRKQLNCTAARAAMCSMPRALDKAGAAAGISILKDKAGGALIKKFCQPRKPTKGDPRIRIMPKEEPENFRLFVKYCITDVRSERELGEFLPQLPRFERTAYLHDLMVNERGIPVDIEAIQKALIVVGELERRIKARVNKMTGGINPTQRDKIMLWMARQGFEMENLQAATIKKLLDDGGVKDPKIRKLLELRVEASKVSTKKLVSMARVACKDARARGTLLFYGAHTGRASGRLVQPQNFIRGLPNKKQQIAHMKVIFKLIKMVTGPEDADMFELMFDNPLTAIAQCMRGFIAATPGKTICVVDYAQIEARLLVWLSGQWDAVQEYVQYDLGKGFDRYVLMGAFLFHIKPEQVTDDQRRIAKNLVLGCGFSLGWKKFIEYCAKAEVIIDEAMSKRAVGAFREKHPAVVRYWKDVENCAIGAVRNKGKRIYLRDISFYCDTEGKFLRIRMPSGRDIYYPSPEVAEIVRFGKPAWQLSFMDEIKGRWMRVTTYGGRLVENIVQGTARDIMVIGALNAEKASYPVILWVHDELLAEVDDSMTNPEELEHIVCKMPPWIGKCPVKAEGFITPRYRKG